MTKNQLEFKKQQNRLKRAIKRLEKQGYFDFNFEIPTTPKRVTKKRIEEIKSIKPKHILKNAQHVDFETGWVRSAEEVRAEKKQIAIQKRKRTIEEKRKRIEEEKRKRIEEEKPNDTSTYLGKGETIPTLSTIEMVQNRLNELVNMPRFQNTLAGEKVKALLDIFHYNLEHTESDYHYNKYVQYISEHLDDIAENSTIIEFSSDDKVEFSVALNTLIEILNGGESLSLTQAITLGEVSDYL